MSKILNKLLKGSRAERPSGDFGNFKKSDHVTKKVVKGLHSVSTLLRGSPESFDFVRENEKALRRIKTLKSLSKTPESAQSEKELRKYDKVAKSISQLHERSSSSSEESARLDFFRLAFSDLFYDYFFKAFVEAANDRRYEDIVPAEYKQSILSFSRKHLDLDDDEYGDGYIADTFKDFCDTGNIPIKLVISHLPGDEKGYGSILSKFIGKNFTRMGYVHLGLQIGCYIIDWNNSAIVRPRVFRSENAIACIDLNNTKHKFGDEDFFRTIAAKCVMFNIHSKYKVNATKKDLQKARMSCHTFVFYMLEKMGLDFWWDDDKDGAIYNLMQQIRKQGNSDSALSFKLEFSDPLRPSLSEIQFVSKLRYPNGGEYNDQDFQLLRSYESACFLRGEMYSKELKRHLLVRKRGEDTLDEGEKVKIFNPFRRVVLNKKVPKFRDAMREKYSDEEDDYYSDDDDFGRLDD